MFLQRLSLVNFRNHTESLYDFTSSINCIVGRNGSGKTSVLDAIHYLSMCRSYLNSIDKQNVRFDQGFFIIQADWEKNQQVHNLYCGVKIGAKKVFKKNKKEYQKLAEHIGQFPVVMISPYDQDLISESSEVRRKWMDGIIAQFDKQFLSDLQRYNRVIEQRNAVLKQNYENGLFQREPLEIWDEQLKLYGTKVFEARTTFIEAFTPLFQHFYSFISENQETVSLKYVSVLQQENFETVLQKSFPKDMRVQYTSAGVHRDDLVFSIGEQTVRKFASQGQQKSYLIALRLAQFEWLKKELNTLPVLLLDDIFDKLDNFRVAKLMELVSENTFGQVFLTDTDKERVLRIFAEINEVPKIIDFNEISA